jgi:predicted nucleic acid-binding protein
MILVDTSVLIDYLEGRESAAALRFHEILERGIPFGLSPITCMEVLQGARTESDFARLGEYLESQTRYDLKEGLASYTEAAKISFRLRRRGSSVGSSIDCLIAQTAIEHDLFILHNDSDFERIARVSSLKIY